MSGDNLYILFYIYRIVGLKKNPIKSMFLFNSMTVSVKLLWDLSFLIALSADTLANRLSGAQRWTLDAGASNWHGRITAANGQRPRLCHLSLAVLCPPAAPSTRDDGTQSRPPATKTTLSDFCCCLTSPSTGTLTAQRTIVFIRGICCTFSTG